MKSYSLEHSGLRDRCTSEKSVPMWVTVHENCMPRITKPAESLLHPHPSPGPAAVCITLGENCLSCEIQKLDTCNFYLLLEPSESHLLSESLGGNDSLQGNSYEKKENM